MEKNNFEEKAYKVLYEKYRELVNHLIQESRNHTNTNENFQIIEENRENYLKKKSDKFDQISNLEKWSYYGLMSSEDIAVVKALEHCLGERYGLHEKTK